MQVKGNAGVYQLVADLQDKSTDQLFLYFGMQFDLRSSLIGTAVVSLTV